jgi:hypothetical protein
METTRGRELRSILPERDQGLRVQNETMGCGQVAHAITPITPIAPIYYPATPQVGPTARSFESIDIRHKAIPQQTAVTTSIAKRKAPSHLVYTIWIANWQTEKQALKLCNKSMRLLPIWVARQNYLLLTSAKTGISSLTCSTWRKLRLHWQRL